MCIVYVLYSTIACTASFVNSSQQKRNLLVPIVKLHKLGFFGAAFPVFCAMALIKTQPFLCIWNCINSFSYSHFSHAAANARRWRRDPSFMTSFMFVCVWEREICVMQAKWPLAGKRRKKTLALVWASKSSMNMRTCVVRATSAN